LNGQPGVSDAMRQRILQQANDLGYAPNRMARALVTGRTQQIALWFQFSTTLNHEMAYQFQKLARSSSYDLLNICNQGQAHHSSAVTVDGGIFYGSISPDFVTPFPVVEMLVDLRGKNAGEPPRNDLIIMPMEEASRAAMQHLMEQGCRRIAYISLASMMGNYEPRYRAYMSEMRKAGLPVETITLESPGDGNYRNSAQNVLQKYFQENGFPDALFCSNDDIAIGAYRVLRQMNRRIPEETAVIGCDDIEESKDHVPALTSIQFPCEAICQCAWEMLTARILNPALPPRTETFKARLVVRQSSLRASKVLLKENPR
jgi:LacI family transcriptional regulator